MEIDVGFSHGARNPPIVVVVFVVIGFVVIGFVVIHMAVFFVVVVFVIVPFIVPVSMTCATKMDLLGFSKR